MPRYLLSVHHSADVYNGTRKYLAYDSEEEMNQAFADTGAFNDRLAASGALVFVGGLEPPETARTVDGRAGGTRVAEGPFAPSNEYIGGFWVVETPDIQTAVDLAAQASKACRSAVEVRPFAGQ
ncbi:YciI family protein [Acidipropionibacterium jensenii]|uniref:Uncharacterized protein conserved in bacteria n=1 Tax=Acidipropionibacterium jensenii TaxID=1749 RepID=A0A3S5EVD6_9ACTN|nr:YciI family protein [Acidipropionibacterium jensenii]MDN5978495.1 YciI family protein [Acidipropionibacterium jensenii]MDN5996114.1 YciI family protein [Acidipropionibacterium jensenii]MDN6426219.1 YciI family protein [Acidipropionibacterium jensenii]MDN6441269.1 YciI family protein [Acidipropionibacterium jensenii]MDN6479986.1 YciI family protein [Acidipropionibacterium jensenii]